MSNKPTERFHIELDIRSLESDEGAREDLISGILKLAPNAALYGSAVMQQAIVELGKTFDTYKACGQAVAVDRKQLALDLAAEQKAKNANDKSILLVKSLTENGATCEADITSMAFLARAAKPPEPPLVPPESIDIKMGRRGSGAVTASAHETGKTRRRYAAELSLDPFGANTWSALPGGGKSRKLTGKSGTSVWVRFALVRGQLQSEWSTPVLVTFP